MILCIRSSNLFLYVVFFTYHDVYHVYKYQGDHTPED